MPKSSSNDFQTKNYEIQTMGKSIFYLNNRVAGNFKVHSF